MRVNNYRTCSVALALDLALMDLLNSYDDDEGPVVSAGSFLPVRAVNAGWLHLNFSSMCALVPGFFHFLACFVAHSPVLFAAPSVARTHVINELSGVDPGTKMMQYNVPIDALWAPVAGV